MAFLSTGKTLLIFLFLSSVFALQENSTQTEDVPLIKSLLSKLEDFKRLLPLKECKESCPEGAACSKDCSNSGSSIAVNTPSIPIKISYEFLAIIYLGCLVVAVLTGLFLKVIYEIVFSKEASFNRNAERNDSIRQDFGEDIYNKV